MFEYMGIDLDYYLEYILLGMAVLILIMFILIIIAVVQNKKLKKKYKAFMEGKNGESLEETLIQKLTDMEDLMEANKSNEENITRISDYLENTFQKVGMVKYDAFHEMGGKLSFSLALLNQTDDGFILNAMHTREGCYTYIKEIIKGSSILVLSEEEKEALDVAMGRKIASKDEDESEK